MAGRTLGVADAEPTLDALTVTGTTALGAITGTSLITTGGAQIGNAAADLIAFHDGTPCDQSDTCVALSTSATVKVSGTAIYGFETGAQGDAIATTVNLIRACLREKGLMA